MSIKFKQKIDAEGGIEGLTLTRGITGTNFDINGVNAVYINDPGEGIIFQGENNVHLFAIDDMGNDNKMNFSGASELQVNGSKVALVSDLSDFIERVAPTAPASITLSIVNDTINVTFPASVTSDVDYYVVFSSVAGGEYGLISVIPPDDFSSTMSIIDDSFDVPGTQTYRVYAVKNGMYSSKREGSIGFTVGTVEVTNMSVTPMKKTFFIQWNPPSSKGRFVTAYNVYKHQASTALGVLEASSTLIYTGLDTRFLYQVTGFSNDFHQFWITTTIAS